MANTTIKNQIPPKPTVSKKEGALAVMRQMNQLMNSASLIRRADMFSQLGKDSYGGDRNLYQALGYPETLSEGDYRNRYSRGDIAKRLNDLMPNECFKGGIIISDEGDPEETSEFEAMWWDIEKRTKIWAMLKRADRLCGLGEYSILFLGCDDIENQEGLKNELQSGATLLYVQPYGQDVVTIETWDTDPGSIRFRQPLTYRINSGGDSKQDSINVVVHHSRVIHIAEDLLDSNVYGTPRMKSIYNVLMDLDKIRGGSGEMFWRGARPGYVAKLDEDASGNSQTIDEIKEEMDEFDHNLRRFLRLSGITMTPLAPQIEDPTTHWEIQIKTISVALNIPMRILMGSERGELASSQDERAWKERVEERRTDFVEPSIIRATIDRLIQYSILPIPQGEDYIVTFKDLWALDRLKQSEIAMNLMNALSNYSSNPSNSMIIPIQMFLTEVFGWDEDKATAAAEMIMDDINQEQEETPPTPEPPPAEQPIDEGV